MHTSSMLQVGKSKDVKARDITVKDSPRKLTLPSLPTELRAMIYSTVFKDSTVQIDHFGIGFIHNRDLTEFNRNKRACSLELEGYEDDDMIAALVMYRIADLIMLPVWLARQPKYRTVIRRLSIHVTRLWVSKGYIYGFKTNSRLLAMHLPFWLKPHNMSLKPILPRLKEIDIEVHCTTLSFVGPWIRGTPPKVACQAMMADWKKLATWNPGLAVVLRCLTLKSVKHPF